jgi:hypothetical protein
MRYDIVHGTNSGRAKIISPVELVNFYPEMEDGEKAKYVKALIGCPGYNSVVTAYTEGYCRALYATSTDRLFAIISNKLIEISTSETATVIGTLNTSYSNCVMCDNGSQLLIVDGSNGYICTLATGAFATISGTSLPTDPTHCIFTDGYFLVNSSTTGKFNFSASYDGTSWAALDYATAEYSPDYLIGLAKTSNGTIWMIGKQSLELWNNVGVANLPWRRIQGSVKEIGCIAPYSIASNGNNVFWLGNGLNGYGAVFMGVGYDVVRISTPAIEYQIKQLSNINEANSYTYIEEGHQFYVINFTSEKTFAYDLTTGQWHIRASWNSLTGQNIRNMSQYCAFFNGKNYVGSYKNADIYEMSLDIYDEDGTSIVGKIVTPDISNENELLFHSSLVIDMEKGVGLSGESDPVIMMKYSNDGGYTWSNIRSSSPGGIGEYSARVIWRRLGSARNRVYEITMSDPVKRVISSAFIKVE